MGCRAQWQCSPSPGTACRVVRPQQTAASRSVSRRTRDNSALIVYISFIHCLYIESSVIYIVLRMVYCTIDPIVLYTPCHSMFCLATYICVLVYIPVIYMHRLLNVLLDYHKSYAVQVSTFCDLITHIKSSRHLLPERVLDGKTDRDLPLWVSIHTYIHTFIHSLMPSTRETRSAQYTAI